MTHGERESAPDYAEALEGWRVWRVVERRGELWLASAVRGTVWPPGEALVARCLSPRRVRDRLRRAPRHPAPHRDCECGIYAASRAQAAAYLGPDLPNGLTRVLGRAALWGTVVECEGGLRASHAYPLALGVSSDASLDGRPAADAIAARLRRYGVPVEVVPAQALEAAAA